MSEVTKEQIKKALEFVGIHTDDEDYIRYLIIGQSDHFMNIPIKDFRPHLSLDDMAVLENGLREEDKGTYLDWLKTYIALNNYDSWSEIDLFSAKPEIRFQAFTKMMEEK